MGEKRLSMKMGKMMSGKASVGLILILFLPICSVGLFARWLSDEVGWVLFLFAFAWFLAALVFFSIYKNIKDKKAKYALTLEGPVLRLSQNERALKEFNLSESHKLLIILRDFLDKETLFFQRFADVHLSQGAEALSFRLLLIAQDTKEAPPLGEEAWISCSVEQKKVGNRLFLWLSGNPYLHPFAWEGSYTGEPAIDFLKALDSFSANNALIPYIERAKAGEISLGELRKRL
ncbi:MAG: hypothetical protein ABIM46_09570 [candidate division WOR-3 bacterium]